MEIAARTLQGTTVGASATSREIPSEQVKNRSNTKPNRNWGGGGRGQLSQEAIREQAQAQSAAAKAANARKVTIFAEDEEQTWSLERGFLADHSPLLGSVLSYSGKQADAGIRDPLKGVRGLIRFGDGSGSLQLDDVKADDFDVFLEALRTPETKLTEEDLKVVLALASDWGFDDLRNRTMRSVEKLGLSPIDRAILARRCKITKWIRAALLSLTIVPEPLNAKEIQLLGSTTAAVVWWAREAMFTHRLEVVRAARKLPRQTKCNDDFCKHALRTALLRVLEKNAFAGKSEADLSTLIRKEIWVDERDDLCDHCSSDAGLGVTAGDVVEEFQVGKAVFEQSFGKDDAVWLEPA
ncbi:hypothetical protein FRC01_004081 [Tulasnella sp. 417]|nr:hypothetical protein FRC01_004081 [Tulasnella sp. 417]